MMFRVKTAGGAVLGLLLVFLIGHEACLAFVSPPLRGCHISQQYRVKRRAALRMQAAEVSEEVERVARLIKRDLLDLNDRLMTAPYELGANIPTGATCFSLTKLREEDSPTGTLSQQLCKEMRENHFIIVRLDEEGQSALNGVWMAARRFFDLPSEQKEAIAGRMRKETKHQSRHRRAEGNVGVIGWGTMPDDNEFLEMRVAHGGDVAPHGLDDTLPGFTSATTAARKKLFELSRTVIAAAEAFVSINPGELGGLLDDGTTLAAGQWSSTQHRLCLYHADSEVPFEAHTDTTFLTLIPCSSIAGLEVWTANRGWVRPEEHAESAGSVVVMPGEFLQVLTAGIFPAAVHRVTRFSSKEHAEGGARVTRLSAPLLVRGVKEAAVNASALMRDIRAHEDARDVCSSHQTRRHSGVAQALERLDGVKLYTLHTTLVQPPCLDSL